MVPSIIKCTKGHFFDTARFQVCPLCGSPAAQQSNMPSSTDEAPESKGKLFHWPKPKTKSEKKAIKQDSAQDANQPVEFINKGSSVDQSAADRPAEQRDTKPDFGKTVSGVRRGYNQMYDSFYGGDGNGPIGTSLESTIQDGTADSNHGRNEPDYGLTNNGRSANGAGSNPQETGTLMDAVKTASAASEGKTMSYFYSLSSTDSSVASEASPVLSDPVVGWLVCIGGVHIGESFVISSGMNSIGRSPENKITIGKDRAVSSIKHAVLIFEPKQQRYFIQQGSGSGLTYVNKGNIDALVTETEQLNDRDIVEIGGTRLMLVQLCGDRFSWQDYIK